MAKLILSFEGAVLKTVMLNKERVTLGRKPHNDIQVDNLAVSGEHAVVTTVLNDSVIEDLGSTNGTLVNGELITKHLLRPNDVIELGKHKIVYVTDVPAVTSYNEFEKTMVMRRPGAAAPPPPVANTATTAAVPAMQAKSPEPSGPRLTVTQGPVVPATPATAATVAPVVPPPAAAPARAATAAVAPSAPRRDASLQVLSGPGAGRVMELTKNLTTIGKAGVQVVVFTRRPMGFFVTHVEGEIAPLLNGEPLGAQAHQLSDNDTIELVGVKMNFFYKS